MNSLPIAIVGTVFFFVYLMVRLGTREREEKRRIELVDRALQSGAIDERTKRELVAAVTSRGVPTWSRWLNLGWIGLCGGIGTIVVAMTYHGAHEWLPPGILLTALSFGAISLPVAVRELHRASGRANPAAGGER